MFAKKNSIKNELAILHCVSSYPVETKYANINAIKTLKKNLDWEIGYSDHTLGSLASLLAVSFGARIIEKHFTIDNHFSDFRDHRLSLNPIEMGKLVTMVREIDKMSGSGDKKVQFCESDSKISMRRSIVAKIFLEKGKKLTLDDICWLRPGGGIKPGEESLIIGKRLKKDIKAGQKLFPSDFRD